jgi:hypothetical protein
LPRLGNVLHTQLPPAGGTALPEEVPAALRGGISRARRRALKLAAFFASPTLTIRRDAITEVAGSTDRGSHMSYWEWQLPRARQWVHARQPFGLLPTIADYERVTVVTGSCLFSARSVRYLLEDGGTGPSLLSPYGGTLDRPACGVDVDERLTLYESEVDGGASRAAASWRFRHPPG